MFKGISIGSFLGCCGIKNRFLKSTILYPPLFTCYVFEFDTVTADDQIWAFNYNNGTQDLSGLTISLNASDTEIQIADAIKNAFNTVPITYADVTVSRIDIGGGLFTYTITIKNPNFTIDVIDISGNGTASTTTNCS